MNKCLILAALVAICGAANAKTELITLGYGESATVLEPAKVVKLETLSTVAGGTSTPKRISLVMSERDVVTDYALTNFTYSVVTTNATTGAATTNVLFRPHPLPFPDRMTGYWTNTIVRSWSVTNREPCVAAAFTNAVEANGFVAPGDTIFTPATDTFRGKLNIYLER